MPSNDAPDAIVTDSRLARLAQSPAPAIVVDGTGEFVWTNAPAASLALDDAARRTVARIAASGSEGLARLRIGAGSAREAATFRSSRVRLGNGLRGLLLEAVLPNAARIPSEESAGPPVPVPAFGESSLSAKADLDAPPDPRRALAAVGADCGFASAAPVGNATGGDGAQPPAALGRPISFSFEFDGAGRLSYLSPELAERVGATAKDAVGATWDEMAASLGLDPEGAVGAALASRRGWSDLAVLWPASNGERTAFQLSALPMFDAGRTFVGFRGLGRETGVEPDRSPAQPARSGPNAETVAEATPPGADVVAPAGDAAVPADLEPVVAEPAADAGTGVEPSAPSVADVSDLRDEQPFFAPSQPSETFGPNIVRLREAAATGGAPSPALSSVEESAFDEIARRLRGLGVRTSTTPDLEPAADVPDTADLKTALTPVDEWTIDDVSGRATAVSPVQEMRRLLDKLPIGAIVLRGGEVAHANHAALEMTGHADLASLAARGPEALFGEMLRRDDAAPATLPLVAQDGVELEVEARLSAIGWEGAPATLVSLKRAEAASAAADLAIQREREISEILDTATDGVLTLDSAGRILSANRSAEALFGFEAHEAVGALFTLSLAPESRSAAFDYLDSLKANGVGAVMNGGREVLGLARRGGAIPLYMTLGRIGSSESRRYCAVLRDITPWKRAEEELIAAKRHAERASAQKSDFLAKVGHEIRTPLNAIIGFAQVMMEERLGPIGNDRYKDYLRDIHMSGEQLIVLVNDLLDLSRVESGRMKLDFASVDLNEIVQQAVALLQPQANREHVILRTSLGRNLPPVLADRRSLRQVMTNLVANAVKLSRPGGQVIVATVYTDVGQAVARVRDAGAGMSTRDVARALEPFGRSHAGETDVGSSLPLTKALVEANHAIFRIDSRIGEGTLVEVSFPGSRVLAGSALQRSH